MENKNKGQIFVISGPSGVGKGTILIEILKRHPELYLSVSVTTRKPRAGEINGVNYFFVTKEEFQDLIKQNKLLEWAEFAENCYGTYVKTVQEQLDQGTNVILEIDVQGALQIKNKIEDAILIFIMPPSIEELKIRLIKRHTESKEAMEKRLSIVNSEIEKKNEFDYIIVNDNLEVAINEVEKIIQAERYKK